MQFNCRGCDAVMVFDPEKQDMLCPFCDSVGNERQVGEPSLLVCPSCGGELNPGEFTSASKCPFCGNYIIFDERVAGVLEPKFVLPFRVTQKQAVEAIDAEFGRRLFTPASFLAEKTMMGFKGAYVPFFLYDYDAEVMADYEGTRSSSVMNGSYKKITTQYYQLIRHMKVLYDNVPSVAGQYTTDWVYDLTEPFDYTFLRDFKPQFLSGFEAETYAKGPEEVEPHAREKVGKSVSSIMRGSFEGFDITAKNTDNVSIEPSRSDFALLPVWEYDYSQGGRYYSFYVNAQSGKVIGRSPVSKSKVALYALTWAGLWIALLSIIFSFFV